MENPSEVNSPVVSPHGGDGGQAAVTSPRALGDVAVTKTTTAEAVVPRGGSVVAGGNEGEGGEEEEVAVDDVGGDGDVEQVAGLSGSGGGDGGDVGAVGSGEGSSGDGERVVERAVEVIVVEDVLEEEAPVAVRRSGEPKGKGVALEELMTVPRPVITPLDYAKNSPQEVVMERAQKAPGVLDAILTAVREVREAEMAQSRATEKRDVEDWAGELEEEEEAEAQAQREAEEARGPRMSIVKEAERALAERPRFDEALYDPQVHLFVPSGIDGYIS